MVPFFQKGPFEDQGGVDPGEMGVEPDCSIYRMSISLDIIPGQADHDLDSHLKSAAMEHFHGPQNVIDGMAPLRAPEHLLHH